MLKKYLALPVFSLVLTVAAVFGQTDATVSGNVKDQDGKPIAEASIVAVGHKTAEKRTARCDKDGQFLLSNIPPDSYEITATAANGADVAAIVDLGAGQSRTITLGINTGSSATVVALDNHATTMELGSARLSVNVTSDEVASLPVNGRTFGPLALAAPLVTNSGGASFNEIRFAGQSSEQNRYRLDGVDMSSVVTSYPGFLAVPGYLFRLSMSTESVQEFRTDSAAYGADQGGGTGGQISLVSKSGANDWHGAMFEYFRNNRLQARNFFDDATTEELRMNQFGGSVGGALKPNKLFVFAGTEFLRQRAGSNVFEPVPAPALIGTAVPAAAPWLSAFPVGTQATGDPEAEVAQRSSVARQDESTYTARVDYLPTGRDRLFLRYSCSSGSIVSPDDTAAARSLSGSTTTGHAVFSWSTTMGANTVNELTAGLNRSPSSVTASSIPSWLAEDRVSVAGGFAEPGGLVRLFDGSYGRGTEYAGRSYSVQDAIARTAGAHALKAGVEFRAVRVPFDIFGGSLYSFRDLDSLAANRDADIAYMAELPTREAVQEEWAAYVLDDWRVRSNISIDFGVRYDYFGAPSELKDRAVILNPFTLLSQTARGAFFQASTLGFEPRIALTWAPKRGNGNTVLRMGGGIYNGPFALLDTMLPITEAVPHLLLEGGTLQDTPATLAVNPDTIQDPKALDVSSYGKPQRNVVYTASVQQALPLKMVAQIGYLGILSRHVAQLAEANLATGVDPEMGDTLRPNRAFATIPYITNGGTGSYHGLQTSLNRRFVDSFTLGVSYNWTHGISTSDGAGDEQDPQNPRCLACERGDTSFDVRQSLSVNAVYELPFGVNRRHLSNGMGAALLGGWKVSGVWNVRTGLPLNVSMDRPDEIFYSPSLQSYFSASADLPGDAIAMLNTPGGGEGISLTRPNYVPGVNPYLRNRNSGVWLNAAAFSIPQPGTFGNLGRNALRGPGFSQLDLQLTRSFRLKEKATIQIRADAFNLANHTNFANPETVLSDALLDVAPGAAYNQDLAPGFSVLHSTVGRTVGLGTSRQIQLGMRLEF